MDERTTDISKKVKTELGLRVTAKAAEFRAQEASAVLTIDSIEDMWGCLKKEAEDILVEFYNEMANSINEKEMVKKSGTAGERAPKPACNP